MSFSSNGMAGFPVKSLTADCRAQKAPPRFQKIHHPSQHIWMRFVLFVSLWPFAAVDAHLAPPGNRNILLRHRPGNRSCGKRGGSYLSRCHHPPSHHAPLLPCSMVGKDRAPIGGRRKRQRASAPKREAALRIRIWFPLTRIFPSSCSFLSVREKVSGTVPSREARTFLLTGISYTAPSRSGKPRLFISSDTKKTRRASTSRSARFSTRSVILFSHFDRDPSTRSAIFGFFSRSSMNGRFGRRRRSPSQSASAFAGNPPPSKRVASAKDWPASRMWRTCSFPSSESLKTFTLPETTTYNPSARSPSRKTVSRFSQLP